MPLQLERSTRKPKQMQLTSLVDILCLLLIFFMLTTSFVTTESMEVSIPYSGDSPKRIRTDVMKVFVADDGKIFLGDEEIGRDALQAQLIETFSGAPEQKVLVLSADQVSVQALISVMDLVYLSGGKNMSVAKWKTPQEMAPRAN